MTAVVLIAIAVGVALLRAFAETAFEVLFGYIGARVVWLITFGCVRLDPLEGGESVLANAVGIVFTVFFAVGICTIVQRH